ncbi:MAG: SPFH domain-containing protein [Lachnospiraceae bacterium]|nr:SPFH domain-containing protein [Lachnospiraceae bacterium]
MGFIANQLANVIEWADQKEGMLFWKWQNQEIKKGSKLIIRPGQDAIFLYNGKCEGVFEEEGNFDIESDIIPFLSTLKAFKFGFNTPLRAEVLFINTLEQLVKWGTKNAINLQAPGLPGGMPIRAFGTFSCKIADHDVLIDKLAGVRASYSVEDVKERIIANLDQLLMAHIAKEGRDMFNLQVDARNIAAGIREELDADMLKLGISITEFNIESFNYPEEIRKMQEKAAGQAMVGDVNKYTQMAMADSFGKGGSNGGSIAADMASMQMGMVMGQQMMQNMGMTNNAAAPQAQAAAPAGAKFCPNCGTPTNGAKFCSNCGTQLG